MPCTFHYFPPPEDDGYDADIEDNEDADLSDDPGCNAYEGDSDECACDCDCHCHCHSEDDDVDSDDDDSDNDDSDSSPDNSDSSHTSLEDRQSALDTPNRFGRIQRSGARLQDCMDYPDVPCRIQPCTLNLDQLASHHWRIRMEDSEVPAELESRASFLGLTNSGYDYIHTSMTQYLDGIRNMWDGRTGDGVIFLEDIVNSPERYGPPISPYISQITQAVYQQHWSLAYLTRIYVLNVVERGTTQFISEIYPTERHEYTVFHYGTAEFQGVLGTRIGKIIAYFILGAYVRGTARVSRVCMWRDSTFLQLQFDIEVFNEPEVCD